MINPLNRVAIRQLDRLEKLDGAGIARRTSGGTATNSALFISDPAVATVSELKKVAPAETLASVSPGDKFKLKMDESIATVSSSTGDYIGTLEVRIATRMRKMIDGDNKYEILAAKLTDSEVTVIVRETKRSPAQARTASFPSYLQKKIGDFDIDDPMEINDEIRMEPEQFQDGQKRAVRAIDFTLNLIAGRLGLDHDRVLFGRYAIPVIVNYIDRRSGHITDARERDRLLFWYVQSAMWGRFSGSTESFLDRDLGLAKDLDSTLDNLISE